MLAIGVGAAYAGDGEDGGVTPNTYFSELPGEVATAIGQPPNNVSVNAQFGAPASAYGAAPTGAVMQPNVVPSSG